MVLVPSVCRSDAFRVDFTGVGLDVGVPEEERRWGVRVGVPV